MASFSFRSALLASPVVAFVACDGASDRALAQGSTSVDLGEISVTAPRSGTTVTGDVAQTAVPSAGPAADGPSAVAERRFEEARDRIFTKAGASVTTLNRSAIASKPQGDDQPFNQLLLQLPGVTQDNASNGGFHIRNEHGNVQYRINGVQIPDGISGFNQFLDPAFIGSVSLLTGALPAQYGLRTAGILDIQARTGAFEGGGISLYGGVRGTITPSFVYGGHDGTTDYFFSGRYLRSHLGIENTTASYNPVHDHTVQGREFSYISTQIDPDTRMTYIGGTSVGRYQIPNTPGVTPSFTAFGRSDFDSSRVNQRQNEFTNFNVVAVQRSAGDVDTQLSYFQRYSTLHAKPDVLGDLLFNGVASDVYRSSLVNGIQSDSAWHVLPDHTLRFGFLGSAEQTLSNNNTVVLPIDMVGNPIDAPFNQNDRVNKTGGLVSVYAQDEWRIADRIVLNYGLRFDQMYQFVNANQVSPRASATWTPFDGTVLHAGYARQFTPPQQVLAAPVNPGLTVGTTNQAEVLTGSPVQPERADVYDIGVTQRILPGLDVGVDGYYKLAHNLLDDGQFGQAYVLTEFNYARAYNRGIEIKAVYTDGNFSAYGNVAFAQQKGRLIDTGQYLFGADELAYIATHPIYTDHAQNTTASGGFSYLWQGTRFSVDGIFGSGLRSGFANTSHVPAYYQINLGVSREMQLVEGWKPAQLRLDVINLTDNIYQIRDGTGIGVFAAQYGQRRGVFAGIAQAF